MSFHRTSHLMAETLRNIGRQRPLQDVRVLTTMVGMPFGPKRLVALGDRYFSVFDKTYQQLLMGISPEELDLDETNPDEEDDNG